MNEKLKIDSIEEPKNRNLSEFMAREMVFDFWLGKLDSLRTQNFEVALEKYPSINKELSTLKTGHLEMASIRSIPITGLSFPTPITAKNRVLEQTEKIKKASKHRKLFLIFASLVFLVFFIVLPPWDQWLNQIGLKDKVKTIFKIEKPD